MDKYELKPYQEKAIEEMHNGCVLVGDVGVGKSFTLAMYYQKRESPRDVYVITTAKKRDDRDWEEEFLQVDVGPARDATLHGVLTVDSWNNIGKYVDVKDAFFVFDEQRLVGSGAWTKSFYKIAKSNRWVLLSATPGDVWLDYIPVFVANGFYKNKTEFIREHVVYARWSKFPKVERYLNGGRLVRHRNSILVKMPVVRHTTRRLEWTEVAHDVEMLETVTKRRWNVFESRPLKDVAELFRVSRKVVNSDATRLQEISGLMEKHPRLIVFYNFDYELEMLRSLSLKSMDNSNSSEVSPVSSSKTGSESRSLTGNGSGYNPLSQGRTSQPNHPSLSGAATEPDASSTTSSRSFLTRKQSPISPTSRTLSTTSPRNSTTNLTESTGEEKILSKDGQFSSDLMSDQQRTSRSRQTEKSSRTSLRSGLETEEDTRQRLSSQQLSNRSIVTIPSTDIGTGQDQSFKELGQTASVMDVRSDVNTSSDLQVAEWNGQTGKDSGLSSSAHAAEARTEATPALVVAEWNGHKHQPVPTSERWLYLVQYQAGAEGWNCVATDAMAFWSLPYSYKNWYQAFGRIDRMNTSFKVLNYYSLVSKSWIDLSIRKSLMGKKNFNEVSTGIKL